MNEEKNVIVGEELERAMYMSLGELILTILKVHDEKILQIDAETGEQLSANTLLNRAIHLAKWFKKNNIGIGDCVSTISENRLEYCVIPIAAFLIGAIFAPLNPDYTPGELQHVMNLSKPKLIFCSIKTVDRMVSHQHEFPHLKTIVLFGRRSIYNKQIIMFEEIVKGAKTNPVDDEFEATAVDPDDTVATILSSSGTTGLPKGVMTTHANMTIYMEIISRVLAEMNTEENSTNTEIVTGLSPFFHNMGFMIMFLAIMNANTVVVFSKFSPKLFLESIQKYKITTIIVPPPIIMFLTRHPMVEEFDTTSIKYVRCGAAPLGKEFEQEATTKFKISNVSQNFGMTETTLGVLMTRKDHGRLGSVGSIIPGMKCKVIDEQGNALGPNEEGELCFKGPLIMKGYINDPKATSDMIDQDKWLHTGDVAYYDKDGYFYIVDRIKELIKYNAFQVAPAELEALLLTHSAVADAAVVGVDDPFVGELPLAFVVKKPKHQTSSEELQQFVQDKMSPQKWLRGGVHFIDSIPRNPSGKILRRVLRKKANNELQAKL